MGPNSLVVVYVDPLGIVNIHYPHCTMGIPRAQSLNPKFYTPNPKP